MEMCVIYKREVDEMVAEIEELRKDRERLEWMFNNELSGDEDSGFYIDDTHGNWHNEKFKTPREAIDVAMKESDGK